MGRLDDLAGASFRIVVAEELSAYRCQYYLMSLQSLNGLFVMIGTFEKLERGCVTAEETTLLIAFWMAKQPLKAIVVRPDHYIFGTADSHESALKLLDRLKENLQ